MNLLKREFPAVSSLFSNSLSLIARERRGKSARQPKTRLIVKLINWQISMRLRSTRNRRGDRIASTMLRSKIILACSLGEKGDSNTIPLFFNRASTVNKLLSQSRTNRGK